MLDSYEYIIVGAGSAGCVLANRLSADPAVRVLLIEAGGPDKAFAIHMPAGIPFLIGPPNPFNWYYHTEPQRYLNDRRLYWPRGRGWGGSSSINGMIYIRGNARDYDTWRQMGCEGWSFAEVLPYFKRAECNENGASEHHGVSGPLYVSNGRSRNPLFSAFVEAGAQAGFPRTDDFNGPCQEGFGQYQLTIHKGRRCSTATAYLRPALRRKNLTVMSFAHALRILFVGKRATGIQFLKDGRVLQANATSEVLLAGGAINTPQLLMLSGIGDAETLKRLDITVIEHLKNVGRNLQDHLDCTVHYEATQPITLFSQSRRLRRLRTGAEYLVFGTGLGASPGMQTGGFIKTRSELETPDLQFQVIPALVFDHCRKAADRHGFMTHVCPLRPQSRGFITLKSADPTASPSIQPNYLLETEDRRTLREGIKIARSVFAQKAFDPFRGPEMLPGPEIRSDADLDAYIRRTAETIYHPVGTARMGIDESAVVDPFLRVYGVDGLRVVDASVMPRLVSGNTNAPTIMIAEKAADLVLGRAAPERDRRNAEVHEDT